MKKFTHYFKSLAILSLFVVVTTAKAQTPCSASFFSYANSNGTVALISTSTNTTTATVFNWGINGVYGTYTGPWTIMTFSANGIYTITLQMTNSAPTCTAQATQTINISSVNSSTTCVLNANFGFSPGGSGLVNFNNSSTGTVTGVTYLWNFGDNSPTSTLVSPVHTYTADGIYSATLTANNNFTSNCSSTIVQPIMICIYTPMTPSFSYTPNSGGNVTFTSTSTGTTPATLYNWNFYSAMAPSVANGVNLTQTSANYSLNGNYVVVMQIVNPVSTCTWTASQVIVISTANSSCNIVANFNTTAGTNGLVNFNNTSMGTTGGTTYSWSFGDGGTSTSANPPHTYSANGVYTATLVANNNFSPACSSTKVLTITVNTYCTLNAGFSSSIINGNTLSFLYTTTGTSGGVSNAWNFGDGQTVTGATGTGILHTYNAIGTYTVILTTTKSNITGCVSTASAVVTVTCAANAAFSLTPSGTPLFWNAIPVSPGNVTSAVWNWGDGSTSNTLYTSHTYSAAGTYSICLSVTLSCGSTNMYCNSYAIFRSSGANQDQDVIQVNVIDPATVGIKNYGNNVADFSISPNPNNGSFNLKMNSSNGKVNILVYDLTGKIIYEQALQTNNGYLSKEIELNDVPAGLYFLKANSEGKVFTKKIVINP